MKKANEQLRQYSIFSASFLLLESARGQVVHTEYDPYLAFETAIPIDLDMDGDGINDVQFTLFKATSTSSSSSGPSGFAFYGNALGDAQLAVAPVDPLFLSSSYESVTCYLPAINGVRKIEANISLSASDQWDNGSIMVRAIQCGGEYGPFGQQGEWAFYGPTRDYYVGVKLSSPDTHYGWVRIRHYDNTDYIKDMGVESSPEISVQTPDLFDHVAPAAVNPTLSNDPDTHALIAHFDGAAFEDSLQEYRVILRNSIYTDPMTATRCEITQPGRFISVPKTGGPYSIDLSSLTTDWAGNALMPYQYYKVYIYSKYNYPLSLLNGLSEASNEMQYIPVTEAINEPNTSLMINFWSEDHAIKITSNERITTVSVFDLTGRLILSTQPMDVANSAYSIPFNESPGMYLVECLTKTQISTGKVIVK